MPVCFVKSCGNYYGKTKGAENHKVIYHMLPTSIELVRKWAILCGYKRNEKLPPYPRICSEHFSENCYRRDLQHELLGLPLRRKLKQNAIPDKNLPQKPAEKVMATQETQQKPEITIIPIVIKKDQGAESKKKTSEVFPEQSGPVNKPILTEVIQKQQVNRECVIIPRNIPKKDENKLKENNRSYIRISKNTKDYRLPMRSSIRIAKKKSIETLSDSFTEKVNNKSSKVAKAEKFSDKLKFMAKLQLRYATSGANNEMNMPKFSPIVEEPCSTHEKFVELPKYDLDKALGKIIEKSGALDRHFSEESYERDVPHELLGLPTRCRLKRGAIPDRNLPTDFLKEEIIPESAIDILLAVGLVPATQAAEKSGGLPQDLNKMQIMEDVREGCNVQPSSPGHAEQRSSDSTDQNVTEPVKTEPVQENGFERNHSNGHDLLEGEVDAEVKEEDTSKEEKKSESENEDKNEENSSSASSLSENSNNKRKSEDTEESPIKRLRKDVQEHFSRRDKILNEFVEMSDCNNLDQIQSFSEQVLSEIKTLNEIAREKEREWNNIIHLKKLKEELLIRMQRKRQLILLSETDNHDLNISAFQQSLLKSNQMLQNSRGAHVTEKLKARTMLPKAQAQQIQLQQQIDLADFRQKHRPTLDVQSIIKDYRQRHPETVPRRGRRIRYSTSDGGGDKNNMLGLFHGTRGQLLKTVGVGGDVGGELGILLNTMNGSRESSQNSEEPMQQNTSFKDMLVQFARLSQSERNELIQNAIKPPPPYPEVTVHPVPTTTAPPTNSLLHGILTKTPTKQQQNNSQNNTNITNSKTSFSPTLARLLTAPERSSNNQITSTPATMMGGGNLVHPSNMSISEILSTSKARNEITITPVSSQFESMQQKGDSLVEEESEENADRLVIDESSDIANSRKDENSSDAEDIPQCQGCNQKPAQFVCAGCGNQWYCSRECQVSAWDEHSEVCSG